VLPDFPKLKSEINKVIQIYFRRCVYDYTIAIKQAPKTIIHEGKSSVIRRSNGEEDPTNFMKSETLIELKFDEIPKMTLNDILSKLDTAAQDMAGKMERGFFKSISDDLGRRNRTSDNKGEPLTGKTILKTLKEIFISFDENGLPEMPSIFIAPNLTEKMKMAIKELEEDQNLKQEFEDIMLKKKEDWFAEQASRKLVG